MRPEDGTLSRAFLSAEQVLCVLVLVRASGGSAVLHKTSCYVTQNHHFAYSLKTTVADTRKFKELIKKWRLQVLASFSDFILFTDHSVCKDQS